MLDIKVSMYPQNRLKYTVQMRFCNLYIFVGIGFVWFVLEVKTEEIM